MRISSITSRFGSLVVFALLSLLVATSGAKAFDPDRFADESTEPTSILRYGVNALKDGRTDEAVGAFRLGAKRDHLPSKWKLARMLQEGEGIPKDELAAFGLFEEIAEHFSDIPPTRNDRPYVSSALVSVGKFHLHGIPGTRVSTNAGLAEFYFYRAAALYGNAEAQYQLGDLYASGQLGTARPRSAARWYGLAARKGHAGAQAELGEMLFYGEGVGRNRVKGLVYLSRAAANGAKHQVGEFREKRQQALAKATLRQRMAAQSMIARFKFPQPQLDVATSKDATAIFGLTTRAAGAGQ